MLAGRFAQGEKNHLKLYFAGPLFSIAEKTGLPGFVWVMLELPHWAA